jgi:hypothetical protein
MAPNAANLHADPQKVPANLVDHRQMKTKPVDPENDLSQTGAKTRHNAAKTVHHSTKVFLPPPPIIRPSTQ